MPRAAGSIEGAWHRFTNVLYAIADTRMFSAPQFGRSHAHSIINSLRSNVSMELEDVGSALRVLNQHLEGHHALIRLCIQAACVKALSKELWNESIEEDSSDDDSEEDEPKPVRHTAHQANGSPTNPLSNMKTGSIISFLIDQLQEVPHMRSVFGKFVTALGPDGIWEVLQETNKQIQEGSAITYSDRCQRKRTPGGIFIKLAKERVAMYEKQVQAVAVPEFKLRPYQAQVVERITTVGGNWVVVAPTNTGKTAIFIEHSKRVLSAVPGGTVVVVVPTVSLVRQQCTAYEKAGFRPATGRSDMDTTVPAVDWFCGDKPLPPQCWRDEVGRLGVIVIEAQSFSLLLQSKVACLSHIQLLVLDECHHTNKQHPYARIMEHYAMVHPRPQVLGFSASPVNGRTEERVEVELAKLLNLMQARLHVVPEDDEHVQQVAPLPDQEEAAVPARQEDGLVQEWLRHTMHAYAEVVSSALLTELAKPNVPRESAENAIRALGTEGKVPSALEVVSSEIMAYNRLCQWMNSAMELAHNWRLPRLGQCVQVLEVLRRSEALCEDVGFECALQYVAQRFVVMCSTRTAPPSLVAHHHHQQQQNLKRRHCQVTAPTPVDVMNARLGSAGPLASLAAYAQTAPKAHDWLATQPLLSLKPCRDVAMNATAMCYSILQGFADWKPPRSPLSPSCKPSVQAIDEKRRQPLPDASDVCLELTSQSVQPLVPGSLQPAPACHPKIWALIQYLQRYSAKPEFHGIIFCRSRQGAHFLVEVLRAACIPHSADPAQRPWLWFIDDIALFVGHGSTVDDKSRSIPGSIVSGLHAAQGHGLAAKGMDVKQQQQALEKFKTPGRKLLVATNAAEEGLDLPCCEFVVRFSPPASGIQRVQGRGRARKHGAHYMVLVQEKPPGSLHHGGDDEQLHLKSAKEEANLRVAMARLAQAQNMNLAQTRGVETVVSVN